MEQLVHYLEGLVNMDHQMNWCPIFYMHWINFRRQDTKKWTTTSTDSAEEQGVSVSIILIFQDREVFAAKVSTSDEPMQQQSKHRSNFVSWVND
jgi:hypothetical protein